MAHYTVTYAANQQVFKAVSDPQLVETAHRIPQLPLWELPEGISLHPVWGVGSLRESYLRQAVETFATFFRTPREATSHDLALADVITQSAAVIISSHIEAQERVRAEQALRESEALFQTFVMASWDVVYQMSPDWKEMRYLKGKAFLADAEPLVPRWATEHDHELRQSR